MDQFQQNLDASLETLVTHDIELTLTYLMMMIIAITTTSMVMMMLMMIMKKKKKRKIVVHTQTNELVSLSVQIT